MTDFRGLYTDKKIQQAIHDDHTPRGMIIRQLLQERGEARDSLKSIGLTSAPKEIGRIVDEYFARHQENTNAD